MFMDRQRVEWVKWRLALGNSRSQPPVVNQVCTSASITDLAISAGDVWGNSLKEHIQRLRQTTPNKMTSETKVPQSATQKGKAGRLPFSDPSISKTKSQLSPTLKPFIPSHLRKSAPPPLPKDSPTPIRAKPISAYGAELVLGRMTPASSIRTPSITMSLGRSSSDSPQKTFSELNPIHLSTGDAEIDEHGIDLDDWSTIISSPSIPTKLRPTFLPAWLHGMKISIRTEVYSPHPGGPNPSNKAQAYSRVILIDTLDNPKLEWEKVTWRVPEEGKREVDNRLYFPCDVKVVSGDGSWGVAIGDKVMYLGHGKFWCGGLVIQFSSRRAVKGDISAIKKTLREEFAWLVGVEVDLGSLEAIVARGGPVSGEMKVGRWRDERGRDVKRELRPEMFIL